MIKIANNLQRLARKQAQGQAPLAPSMPPPPPPPTPAPTGLMGGLKRIASKGMQAAERGLTAADQAIQSGKEKIPGMIQQGKDLVGRAAEGVAGSPKAIYQPFMPSLEKFWQSMRQYMPGQRPNAYPYPFQDLRFFPKYDSAEMQPIPPADPNVPAEIEHLPYPIDDRQELESLIGNKYSMAKKQAQGALPLPVSGRPLSPYNFFSPMQRNFQQANSNLHRDLSQGISGLNSGYAHMVGPDGVPELLRRGQQFTSDAAQAAGPLAQDLGQNYVMSANAVDQFNNLGHNALNYVEDVIPQAQGLGRSLIDSANTFTEGVRPAIEQEQEAVQRAMKSLGSRLGRIGKGLIDNPLGRQQPPQ